MNLEQFATAIQTTSLSTALKSASWVVPFTQSVHIIMVGVVFISILMISLRLLGWMRADEPLASVWSRFAPFLWGGLAVMAITGLVLVVAEPVREFMTLSFRLKMVLLAVCVASAALFGSVARRAALVAGKSSGVSTGVRVAAAATLLLWIAIIFCGRAIAYDSSVWGSWSPMKSLGGAST
jgi:uncharacterized protein DUF6644